MKENIGSVNILGTQYEVYKQGESENIKLKDNSGISEFYTKEIIIDPVDFSDDVFDTDCGFMNLDNKEIDFTKVSSVCLALFCKDRRLTSAIFLKISIILACEF